MAKLIRTLGIGLSSLGHWLAWPGNELSNFGIWLSNINCQCEMCVAARSKSTPDILRSDD